MTSTFCSASLSGFLRPRLAFFLSGILLLLSAQGRQLRAAEDWPELTDFCRGVLDELSATQELGSLIFHYRPGDLPKSVLDEDFAANASAYEELQGKLRMTYEGKIHVFLYRDGDDMQKTTAGDANIAFSTGTSSIHQVHDFRGVHEYTHIFALQFAEVAAAAGPDGFLVEGLATAMAESDQGVPVHSWASVYRQVGRLPELWSFRAEWMKAPPGVHPYHVAASFVLYLVERFGIEATKVYYQNSTEAYQCFEVGFPTLERNWLEFLASHEVIAAHRRHVLDRLGLNLEPVPERWASADGRRPLEASFKNSFEADRAESWRLEKGVLQAEHDDAWTLLTLRRPAPSELGVRLRLRLLSGDAFKLVTHRTGKHSNEVILAHWCTYLSNRQGGYVPAEDFKVRHGVWTDLTLVHQKGRARLYFDGHLILDQEDAFHRGQGRLQLGIERGKAEIADLVIFDPQ